MNYSPAHRRQVLLRTGNQIGPSPGSSKGWEPGDSGERRQMWVRVGRQHPSRCRGKAPLGPEWPHGNPGAVPWGSVLCKAARASLSLTLQRCWAGWDQDVPFITAFASENQVVFVGSSLGRLRRCSMGAVSPPAMPPSWGQGTCQQQGPSILPTRAFGKSKDLKLSPASAARRALCNPGHALPGGSEKVQSSARLGSASILCLL